MKFEEELALGRIRQFGVSALIATIIALLGFIIGATFMLDFGLFMLFVIGLLTAAAVIEYIWLSRFSRA